MKSESPEGLYCFSVSSAGNSKSFVFNSNQASVQLASSMARVSVGFVSSGGGGSVESQEIEIIKREIKKRKTS